MSIYKVSKNHTMTFIDMAFRKLIMILGRLVRFYVRKTSWLHQGFNGLSED